jgi:hypothetical protein
MIRKLILASAVALLALAPAHAETSTVRSVIMPGGGKGGEVRVMVRVNFFVAAPVDDSEASLKAQQDARRKLYESAARECDVLRASIAAQCRIDSINVNINVNRPYGRSGNEGFNASGNFGFRVTLK